MKEVINKFMDDYVMPALYTGIVFTTLSLSCSLFCKPLRRSPENPSLRVRLSYQNTLIYSKHPGKLYVDKQPFGNLDYIIDQMNEERIEREPTEQECNDFNGFVEELTND